MSNLVLVTARILAPASILAAGLILMMGSPTDVLLTLVRVIAGAFVLPVAMVFAASILQAWWVRRRGPQRTERQPESAPFMTLFD